MGSTVQKNFYECVTHCIVMSKIWFGLDWKGYNWNSKSITNFSFNFQPNKENFLYVFLPIFFCQPNRGE